LVCSEKLLNCNPKQESKQEARRHTTSLPWKKNVPHSRNGISFLFCWESRACARRLLYIVIQGDNESKASGLPHSKCKYGAKKNNFETCLGIVELSVRIITFRTIVGEPRSIFSWSVIFRGTSRISHNKNADRFESLSQIEIFSAILTSFSSGFTFTVLPCLARYKI